LQPSGAYKTRKYTAVILPQQSTAVCLFGSNLSCGLSVSGGFDQTSRLNSDSSDTPLPYIFTTDWCWRSFHWVHHG